MSYFKTTPSFGQPPMGDAADFLKNLFGSGSSGGGSSSSGAPASGSSGDTSVSGENPDWYNKLSDGQKPYFAKNGAQLAPVPGGAVMCPRIGANGSPLERNAFGWCVPPKKSEPGFFENAGGALLNFITGGGDKKPSGGGGAAPQVIVQKESGISTGTLVAVGVGAVGLLAVVLIATGKKKD